MDGQFWCRESGQVNLNQVAVGFENENTVDLKISLRCHDLAHIQVILAEPADPCLAAGPTRVPLGDFVQSEASDDELWESGGIAERRAS